MNKVGVQYLVFIFVKVLKQSLLHKFGAYLKQMSSTDCQTRISSNLQEAKVIKLKMLWVG